MLRICRLAVNSLALRFCICPTVAVAVSELDFVHIGLKPMMAGFISTGILSVNFRFYRGEFVRWLTQ